MKKNKKILLAIIMVVIVLLVGISINLISNNDAQLLTKSKIIKEMSESEQVTDLNNQINTLNTEHTEYAKNVQNYKKKIAEAITNAGVVTSEDDIVDVMVTNIGNIVSEATKDATATAEQILTGKTAWVNGNKLTGTMVNNGAQNTTLNSGESYTIPEGYHNGSGTVTVNSSSTKLLAKGKYTSPNSGESWATISYGKTLNVTPYIVINTYGSNYSCLSYVRNVTNTSFNIYYNATNSGTIVWYAFETEPTL